MGNSSFITVPLDSKAGGGGGGCGNSAAVALSLLTALSVALIIKRKG
jgi:hypothetical protein